MAFNPNIKQGDILSNKRLSEIFECGNMGGMRRSHNTNTLVIVSDHTKSLYDDKWYGNEFHYTGMGKLGNQSLTFMQNRTLAESASNGVAVHLFEVFNAGEYIYQGEVQLSNKPYEESQPDDNWNLRSVWMFPLLLVQGQPIRIDDKDLKRTAINKAKKTKTYSVGKLKKIVEPKPKKPATTRDTQTKSFDRDPFVVEYALLRAKGECQLCDLPAPFKKKSGEPYLQVHHIDYLANGGSDTYDNVIGLCPNCHAKMHTLEDKKDITKLKKLAIIQL